MTPSPFSGCDREDSILHDADRAIDMCLSPYQNTGPRKYRIFLVLLAVVSQGAYSRTFLLHE